MPPTKPPKNKLKSPLQLKCFDLCCGAGGLSYGFHLAGAKVLGGVDTNPNAIATARLNDGSSEWEELDIAELPAVARSSPTHPVNRANTILAGLPCQGFSVAGHRDPKDIRNFLYLDLLRLLSSLHPEHVIFENVRGLLS